MSIKNLKKYIAEAYPVNDGFSQVGTVAMEEYESGGYFKAEEAIEAYSNDIQHIKNEIKAALDIFCNCPPIELSKHIDLLVNKLRELSQD